MNNMLDSIQNILQAPASSTNPDVFEDHKLTNFINTESQKIVNKYIGNPSTNLNLEVAKVARINDLNNDSIQRIVEKVNTEIYLAMYGKFKGEEIRDVKFDIADPKKIEDILTNGTGLPKEDTMKKDLKSTSENNNNTEDKGLQKKASYEETHDFNFTPFESTIGFDNIADHGMLRSDEEFEAMGLHQLKKIANTTFEVISRDLSNAFNEVTHDIDKYASYIAKQACLGEEPQDIHDYVVRESGLPHQLEGLVRQAVNEKIASYKKSYRLPQDLNIEIDRPSIDGLKEDLVKSASQTIKGLGTHSKISIDNKLLDFNDNKVMLDDGTIIDSVKNIVNDVAGLKKKHDNFMVQRQKKAKFQEIMLEKLGSTNNAAEITGKIMNGLKTKAKRTADTITGKRWTEAKHNVNIAEGLKKAVGEGKSKADEVRQRTLDIARGKNWKDASKSQEIGQELEAQDAWEKNRKLDDKVIKDNVSKYFRDNYKNVSDDVVKQWQDKMVAEHSGKKAHDAVKDIYRENDPKILREGTKTIALDGSLGLGGYLATRKALKKKMENKEGDK